MQWAKFLLRSILGRRFPVTLGKIELNGPIDGITISRDRWGIPHIKTKNGDDAHFGLGFCQGQDRAFQLEILFRVIRGTLSEILGKVAIPVDRLSRRIGFYRSAREQWAVLDLEIQRMLDAFARGINAGRTAGVSALAHEFVFLGTRPSTWTAIDSVALVKLMSFNLPSNWDVELARLQVLLTDGPQALMHLDPAYDPEQLVTVPVGCKAGPTLDRLAEEIHSFGEVMGRGSGSNNWALSRSKTTAGRPILANDPHMEARLPSHWYLAHLQTPDWSVAGASFTGGPGILVGHNGTAAWGLTAGLIDNTDLFREQIGPDGTSVREGEDWIPCRVLEEKINVKGGESIVEKVLLTPRGPIVGPALQGEIEAISMRATWLDVRPMQGLLSAHRARNWTEFRGLLARWPALPQSIVYADTSGCIGYQLVGDAPQRKKGYGLLPLPGWDQQSGWESEPVPFEKMPTQTNPPEGFVASANTQPLANDVPPFLGADWIDGYRLERILNLLRNRSDWDIASTLHMQTDQKAQVWDELRSIMLAIPAQDEATITGVELLSQWDGVLSPESSAASVYELWIAEMATRVAKAKAPQSFRIILGQGMSVLTSNNFWCFRRTGHLSRLLREQPEGWFKRSWSEELADALRSVIFQLRKRYGRNPNSWKWGQIRSMTLKHPLGQNGGLLGKIYNLGPVPCGGDTDTINQASALPLKPLASPANIASLRVVIDVGNWGNSRFVLPGGQSGNPLSAHYDDLFGFWLRGEGVPIAWTEKEVQQNSVSTLELTPIKSSL